MDDDVLLDTPRERDVLVGLKVQSGYKQEGTFALHAHRHRSGHMGVSGSRKLPALTGRQ